MTKIKYNVYFYWLSDGFKDSMQLDTMKDLVYNLEEIAEHGDRIITKIEKVYNTMDKCRINRLEKKFIKIF